MNTALIIATIKYSSTCQFLTWTLSKVKAACRLAKFVFSRLLQDGAGNRLHFTHSFNSGCYHHSTMENKIAVCEVVSFHITTNKFNLFI